MARNPVTGQFMADDLVDRYDDLEYWHFNKQIVMDDADLSSGGNTVDFQHDAGFEGEEIVDIDDLVDRQGTAVLEIATIGTLVYRPNAAHPDADQLRAAAELSASPNREMAVPKKPASDYNQVGDDSGTGVTPEEFQADSDTADLITMPALTYQETTYDDETNGSGGSGTSVTPSYVHGPLPGNWEFDRRDEIYLNGIFQHNGNNSSDDFVMETQGLLVFGIED